MGLIIILFISVILNIVLIWVVSNLYVKNTELESIVKDMADLEDSVIKYHKVVLGVLSNAYTEFVRIDKRGSFSSDDEVGWSFRLLKDIMNDVVEKMKSIELDGEEKEGK